jgi:TorA maturation chaperone TorD
VSARAYEARGHAEEAAPVREALERAQAFLTLARAFEAPRADSRAEPSRAGRAAAEGTGEDALRARLEALRGRADATLAAALERAVEALARIDAGPGRRALADEYDRLLGGRGGVPARESGWSDPRRVAPGELADVLGFARAFGLETRGELPDHVACECELASLLALKEAYALAEGWPQQAGIASEAYCRLLADHLVPWLPRFAARVAAETHSPFYAAAADALGALVQGEAQRLGLDAHVAGPVAPLGTGEPEEIACGGCRGVGPG